MSDDDVYDREIKRANWFTDAGQDQRAIQILTRLLASYPDNAGYTYKALAAAHNSADRFADSEAAARRAVAALPDDNDVHRFLAYSLINQNREPEAERSLRTALELDPEDDLSHNLMSMALIEMNRREEALFYAREAVRISPDFAAHHTALALAQMKEDPKAAETALQEALRLDPLNEHALLLQSQVLNRRRKHRGAAKALAAYMAQTSSYETGRNAINALFVNIIIVAHLGLIASALLLLMFLSLVRIADLSSWLLLLPLILTTVPTYRSTTARMRSFRLAFTGRTRRIMRSLIRNQPLLGLWAVAVAALWTWLPVGFIRTLQGRDTVLISVAGASLAFTALLWSASALAAHRRSG